MIYFYFREPDGVTFTDFSAGVDFTRSDAFTVTANAEQMSVGTGSMIVDDKLGTWDFSGLRKVFIVETLATFTHIWAGYTAEIDVYRDTYRAGSTARVWSLALTDINSVGTRRIFPPSLTTANRPAETDVERMQWLATTDQFEIVDDVATYLSTDSPVDMDAADYRGQYVSDVIDDCVQQSGKNAYILEGVGVLYPYTLWYGDPDLAVYDSAASISNVLADVNGTTVFAASLDTRLTRDPSRIYSGMYLNWDGGATYQERTATADDFAQRDTISQASHVNTSAQASARVTRMLEAISTPEDVITTTLTSVPAAHVNDIRYGMRVQAKFSHLPDYDAYSWMRVLNRTVTLASPPDVSGASLYDVQLTLSPVTPTPPTLPAFAELQYEHGMYVFSGSWVHAPAAGLSGSVFWESTGDSPHSGFPPAPLVGDLAYTATNTVPGGGAYYPGFTVTGAVGGTLSASAKCSVAAVVSGTVSITLHINKNGASVASASSSSSGGLRFVAPVLVAVTSSPVATVPGDLWTTSMTWTGSWNDDMTAPAGVAGSDHIFTVTGSLS